MPEESRDPDPLRREINYYKRSLNELAGENLKADYRISGLRKKVRQTQQAIALLSQLPRTVADKEISDIFETVLLAINASLGMDKTVILTPADQAHHYRPTHWTGFTEEDRGEQFAQRMAETVLAFPPAFAEGTGALLVNRSAEPTPLIETIRSTFELPYFVCVPMIDEVTPLGLILSGRTKEAGSIFPPMDQGDVKTFESIAGVVLAAVLGQRVGMLKAENERKAMELEQAKILEQAHQKLQRAHEELAASHKELKTTQAQLIQSEKMASLGQLTAGIAHEIKNPLNFVNNFAELSIDIADELCEDLAQHPAVLASVEDLLTDLKENARRISQQGKRADSIVHAMIQHASTGTGQRTPTDINTLVSEHIDLAYHGKRAQVPGLLVEIERDLGEDIGDAEMVPQEIGRVLLNLLGNAFDAVHEHIAKAGGAYTPTVTVSTRQIDGHVEIRVTDNGPGIPAEIRDRIFEPFFTTKPAGSGTGLGLSLSYDMVTQGHGGTLTVETEEGEGATFVIALPHEAKPTDGVNQSP